MSTLKKKLHYLSIPHGLYFDFATGSTGNTHALIACLFHNWGRECLLSYANKENKYTVGEKAQDVEYHKITRRLTSSSEERTEGDPMFSHISLNHLRRGPVKKNLYCATCCSSSHPYLMQWKCILHVNPLPCLSARPLIRLGAGDQLPDILTVEKPKMGNPHSKLHQHWLHCPLDDIRAVLMSRVVQTSPFTFRDTNNMST